MAQPYKTGKGIKENRVTQFKFFASKATLNRVKCSLNQFVDSCFAFYGSETMMNLVLYKFPWLFYKINVLTGAQVWQDTHRPGLLWIFSDLRGRQVKAARFLEQFFDV